ncbi:MAG TPA: hypothetical protein VG841_05980 [Caulobacterales bacterium]|nr:hypothetical protein [Caulobacterales bacterium]
MSERESDPEIMRAMDQTLFSSLEDLRKQISDLRVAVAALPARAGVWIASGSLALIVAVATAAYVLGGRIEGLQTSDRFYVDQVSHLNAQAAQLETRAQTLETQVSAQSERLDALAVEVRVDAPAQANDQQFARAH